MSLEFFVFIDAGENDVGTIRMSLLAIEHVVLVHCPLGPTDLICLVAADSIEQMHHEIIPAIHKLFNARTHPIRHTETMLVLQRYGKKLDREHNNDPPGIAVWVLTNIAVNDLGIVETFLGKSPYAQSVFNVIGRYDSLVYIETPSFDALHQILDDSIRRLCTMVEGSNRHVVQSTDTRIVLNYKAF